MKTVSSIVQKQPPENRNSADALRVNGTPQQGRNNLSYAPYKPNGCPKCGNKKYWKVRRERRKCSACRHEYRDKPLPNTLSRKQWHDLIKWFVLDQSVASIVEQTGIGRYKVMKALMLVRERLFADIPVVFRRLVTVYGTPLFGQLRDLRQDREITERNPENGSGNEPVFGILCYEGKIHAEIILLLDAQALFEMTSRKVRDIVLCINTLKSYKGIAEKGSVEWMADQGEGEHAGRVRDNINVLKGFLGYLKKRLISKGGIRRERLPFYLAEYAWRYNNRDLNVAQKSKAIWRLMFGKKQ